MATTSEKVAGVLRGSVGHESIRAFTDAILAAAGLSELKSVPPSGKCKVTNIYVDPVTGKVIVDYDDTPVP